ncbi:hypothetical protein K466DRAFT_395212 [Polyporus arcularius HHB13444]|uniref:Uncharacterized protein n=1 Tax=Polyporus arcularius HHB13444 TaxID=1314778 RepID=A0A5C3PKF5_9APHY|nr:hypothetical protein K466DRAFT_395212 [Polyporus arcularius HHB13444]
MSKSHILRAGRARRAQVRDRATHHIHQVRLRSYSPHSFEGLLVCAGHTAHSSNSIYSKCAIRVQGIATLARGREVTRGIMSVHTCALRAARSSRSCQYIRLRDSTLPS